MQSKISKTLGEGGRPASTTLNSNGQVIDKIKTLPRDRNQISALVKCFKKRQLEDISQVCGAWVHEVEKSLGCNKAVRKSFVTLAMQWHDETDYLSSPSRITDNDTYLKIVSMGGPVIPLILQDLQKRGGNWYRALRILSDEDPVSPEVRGEVPKMKEAWLHWGRDKGYIK